MRTTLRARAVRITAILAGIFALLTGATLATAAAASASPVVTVSYAGNQVDNSHVQLGIQLNAAKTALTLSPVPGTLKVPSSGPVDFTLNGSNPGWSLTGNVLTGTSASDPNLVAKDQIGDVVFFHLRGLSTDAGGVFFSNSDSTKCVTSTVPSFTFPFGPATLMLNTPFCVTDDVIMGDPTTTSPVVFVYGSDGSVHSQATPPVTYALYNGLTGTSAVPGAQIDPNTGVISSDPSTAVNGFHTYTVRVVGTDTVDAAGTTEFQITVAASGVIADSVTVSDPGSQASLVGTAISPLTIHASSSAGNPITGFSATNLPAGLSINTSTGVISGTPTTSETNLVTVTATDGTAGGSANFSWTVSTVVVPPPVTMHFGDFVNQFGSGFNAFKQHAGWNSIVASWPFSSSDRASNFLVENEGSNFRLEWAPSGAASGWCVSNATGTALVFRPCNTGPWQQFRVSGDQVVSVVSGGDVRANGNGAQLTVGAPNRSYHWVEIP